jgi:hypothetical protein
MINIIHVRCKIVGTNCGTLSHPPELPIEEIESMNRKDLSLAAVALLMLGMTTGCSSEADKQISEQQKQIEKTADAQKDSVDKAADRSKDQVEEGTDRAKEVAEENADLTKKKIETSAEATKQAIEDNADAKKDALEVEKKTN